MNAKDLVLNIAINLGRLSRWMAENKQKRIPYFLDETQNYLIQLENARKNRDFIPTFQKFRAEFIRLKNHPSKDQSWAEEMLTWANILQHRAKLA